MKASEAKKITKAALTKVEKIGHLMRIVYGEIEQAAKRGECTYRGNPFAGLRMPEPEPRQIEAVRKHLVADGYTLGPDHGRVGINFVISWPST